MNECYCESYNIVTSNRGRISRHRYETLIVMLSAISSEPHTRINNNNMRVHKNE